MFYDWFFASLGFVTIFGKFPMALSVVSHGVALTTPQEFYLKCLGI